VSILFYSEDKNLLDKVFEITTDEEIIRIDPLPQTEEECSLYTKIAPETSVVITDEKRLNDGSARRIADHLNSELVVVSKSPEDDKFKYSKNEMCGNVVCSTSNLKYVILVVKNMRKNRKKAETAGTRGIFIPDLLNSLRKDSLNCYTKAQVKTV